MKVGIICSKRIKNYDFGVGHPFGGDRSENFFSFFIQVFSKLRNLFNPDQEKQPLNYCEIHSRLSSFDVCHSQRISLAFLDDLDFSTILSNSIFFSGFTLFSLIICVVLILNINMWSRENYHNSCTSGGTILNRPLRRLPQGFIILET